MGTISATSVTLTQTDQWVTAPEGHGPSEPLLAAVLRAFNENINDRTLWLFNRLALGLLGSHITFASGAVDTGADKVNIPSHGISANTVVRLGNIGGTLLAASGLTAPTVGSLSPTALYVKVVDANNIQFALTSGGSAINITAAGSGTHYLFFVPASVLDLIVHPSMTMAGETMPAQSLKATAGEILTARGGAVTGDLSVAGTLSVTNAGKYRDRDTGTLPDSDTTTTLNVTRRVWYQTTPTAQADHDIDDTGAEDNDEIIVRRPSTGNFAVIIHRPGSAAAIVTLPALTCCAAILRRVGGAWTLLLGSAGTVPGADAG